MQRESLCVSILWHQHQPFYRAAMKGDPAGAYMLPWVRLHSVRDYYPMAALLAEFPDVRATINLVPSLLVQIEDYVENGATDLWMELSLTPTRRLSEFERGFVVSRFFDADRANEIEIHPRYAELFAKRRSGVRMDDRDITDLRMWFNLAWFPPEARQGGVRLPDGTEISVRPFVAKGRGFDDDEIEAVIGQQLAVMRNVVPIHRKLRDEGRIEVSVSPFYHPILPLIADSSLANVDAPGSRLPGRFSRPDDAREQLERAAALCERMLGRRPSGLWPSEGSVGEHVAPIVADAGFRWMATDQGVLERSGRHGYCVDDPEVLLRPYAAGPPSRNVSVFFRHRRLSNDISFNMQRYADQDRAAGEFVGWLREGFARRVGRPGDRVLTIALDGENAWGSYRNCGRAFLKGLYGRLSEDPELRAVTFTEFLDGDASRGVRPHPLSEQPSVSPLYCASWIDEMGSAPGNDLNIWIGGPEENRAWDLLGDARRRLAASGATQKTHPDSFEALYAAEGSDWFWWFGDDFSLPSGSDLVFDLLFRERLKDVYRGLGEEPPVVLDRPIRRSVAVWSEEAPLSRIAPGRKLRILVGRPGAVLWRESGREHWDARELEPMWCETDRPVGYATTIGPFGVGTSRVEFRTLEADGTEWGETRTIDVVFGPRPSAGT